MAAPRSDIFQGLAKYIVAIACSSLSSPPDDEEKIARIEKVLRDTFQDKILAVVDKPAQEWGECARSVNKIVKEIRDNLIKEF